ncbi:MAG: HAMP domain-containing protein [Alicyclobacillaceae bacterium]|nr:HAMP domain-containing protein [Alicyclobacillaceae bacterium]
MIRNSIVSKLWLTIAGLVIVVLGLLSMYLEQMVDTYLYQVQAAAFQKRADYIANVLKQGADPVASTVARHLADEAGATLYVLGSPDSDPLAREVWNRLTIDDRARLLAGGDVIPKAKDFLQDIPRFQGHSNNLWIVVPLRREGNSVSLLVFTQPLEPSQEAMRQIRNSIFYAGGLAILMTTGFAFVISKNLSRPLVQMNEVAERMARGDFHGKVRVVTGDEVGRLGMTLNKLAHDLQENIKALSKEKEQLSSILTSMVDGVVSADLSGQVLLANPPAKRWLRAVSMVEEGRPLEDRLPRDLLDLEKKVISTKSTQVREVVGQGRTLSVTMAPLYEPNSEMLRGVVAVLRDITEELNIDRMRRDFVANVSHELRTPLSMLQGYSEALLDDFIDDPEQRRELAKIILEETLRMRRLVNDLLDLAQLESGQFLMKRMPVDVRPLVHKIWRKFSTLAQERKIPFRLDMQVDEPVIVDADVDRLEQVLTNLIDNAFRHTQPPGGVTIRFGVSEDTVRIAVEDEGAGIPPEDIPHIWERFYKVDKARTRHKGGTGLGLAIAKNIVIQHDGDIIVESELGKGTTFTVLLPLYKPEA